jgi:hypothetical protein
VWFYVSPACSVFQRCAVSVDKLGLTVRPLVAAEKVPDGTKGAVPAAGTARGGGKDVVMLTETLNFPISAVVDVTDETEFKPGDHLAQPVPAPAPPQVERRMGPIVQRRSLIPFARALFSKATADAASSSSSSSKVEPPYPHLVGISVRGSLAGRMHGPEKAPAHMRLNAAPPPPMSMFLSFADKDESRQFVSKMLVHKKYQLSVSLSTYIHTFTAVSQRESVARGHHLTDESPLSLRMQQQGPSLEPPPLPCRPADVPPASRLPRMVTNDEGEVFWYIPRKQQQAQQQTQAAQAAQAQQQKQLQVQRVATSSPKPAGVTAEPSAKPGPSGSRQPPQPLGDPRKELPPEPPPPLELVPSELRAAAQRSPKRLPPKPAAGEPGLDVTPGVVML